METNLIRGSGAPALGWILPTMGVLPLPPALGATSGEIQERDLSAIAGRTHQHTGVQVVSLQSPLRVQVRKALVEVNADIFPLAFSCP